MNRARHRRSGMRPLHPAAIVRLAAVSYGLPVYKVARRFRCGVTTLEKAAAGRAVSFAAAKKLERQLACLSAECRP